ncbi:lactate/malate family dehydrogenase [Thermohalobacter berrensis]|uniref:Lactate dehydrogenase n=1 Tax=Thermohalobacter berrensis TaxID=99594 RepID=A0A419SVA2_9FIRM|nr:lactate dehydrogenase [Thermohalobacter berrensis]RKD29143.1 lactate dehydrogenase [Thermohalobacter berrensis]
MFYYRLKDKILFSRFKYSNLIEIDEKEANKCDSMIYFLTKMDPKKSRRSFAISDPSLLFMKSESVELLQKENTSYNIPSWIEEKVNSLKVVSINTSYPNWQESLNLSYPKKWRINILALGDVGGMLLTGLRLIGGNYISSIGIYDRTPKKVKRWEYEMNQVLSPFDNKKYPEVYGITKEELFDCDMFVFCASKSVPPVGNETKDVRMVQFKDNSKIIKEYAKMARNKNFKGIFSVVSDPVDLLCKVVFLESNRNSNDKLDFQGLAPEQIRGYGLGVMHARACYYAKQDKSTIHYLKEGRAFGPHGKGLIIADSIKNYNNQLSEYLTKKALKANLEVRKTGFKPYIAPALSSGALSILATISGKWHYSSTFLGGVFMGTNNRLIETGTELERLDLPKELFKKIKNTYERLEKIV